MIINAEKNATKLVTISYNNAAFYYIFQAYMHNL